MMFKTPTLDQAFQQCVKELTHFSGYEIVSYDPQGFSDLKTGMCKNLKQGTTHHFKMIVKYDEMIHPNRRYSPSVQVSNSIALS